MNSEIRVLVEFDSDCTNDTWISLVINFTKELVLEFDSDSEFFGD